MLDIPPHYQPETGYGAVNAGNANVEFAYVPQRFAYPQTELQDNKESVEHAIANYLQGGKDGLDTQLWWARPTRENAELKKLIENYNK